MADGRMEFHAQTIMQHANFCFVLPNDVEMEEVREPRHYERPTKSLVLLHGLTGTDTDWMYGGLAHQLSIQYNLAIFMPTTGNSFYLDRGYPGGNFASYVGAELPAYIRSTFGFCQSREDTMIAGLSMGGYGALRTALAFPETYSACIALSSALRIHELAKCADESTSIMPAAMLRDVFGDLETLESSDKNPEVLVRRLLDEAKPLPRIYMACGTEDTLIGANRDFRDFLKREGVPCVYEEGPGMHNWFFWNEYLDRGLASLLG
ncbi:MAG: acetylesterase [Oscillospiraceae bacterium]|nr:acetylesterase [Oscillospiraceae bacterium]